jgi:hypothetical protein
MHMLARALTCIHLVQMKILTPERGELQKFSILLLRRLLVFAFLGP